MKITRRIWYHPQNTWTKEKGRGLFCTAAGTWMYRMIYQTALRFSASSQVVSNSKSFKYTGSRKGGHAVAQLVEVLRYKPEGPRFDSRWCHWNFSLT